MCLEGSCRDDTRMDAVGGAGLRFICGGKVRDLDTILGSTMLVLAVCVRECLTEIIDL